MFEELMFEADWIMKQLSLGIKVNSINPVSTQEMDYHPKLLTLGLAPMTSYKVATVLKPGQQSSNWNRLWLVVKKVDVRTTVREGVKYVEIGHIQMGVEARQMEKDSTGKLRDKVV